MKHNYGMPPLPDSCKIDMNKIGQMHFTAEQEKLINAFATLQGESIAIDMLLNQYAYGNDARKRRCKPLLVEHAELLLKAAESL